MDYDIQVGPDNKVYYLDLNTGGVIGWSHSGDSVSQLEAIAEAITWAETFAQARTLLEAYAVVWQAA